MALLPEPIFRPCPPTQSNQPLPGQPPPLQTADAASLQATDAPPAATAALLGQAVALHRRGRLGEAETLYRQIIERDPQHFDALHLAGVAALQAHRTERGLALIRQAIAQNPNVAEAHANLANGLREQRRYEAALASFDHAIALRPDSAETQRDRAITLQHLGRFAEALVGYRHARALQPDLAFLASMTAHARLAACDWTGLAQDITPLRDAIACGRPEMPFAVVALTDSPALQRRAAEAYVQAKAPADAALPAILPRPRSGRLHIGYFSADFHNHATAYLMAEVFERHTRDHFEITAFSFGGAAHDDMRQRLTRTFDRFIDVHQHSDREVALLARAQGIDIAVDLKGFTQGFRTGIFAARAAPIQVNFLGYPGTMGAPYIDYIIADPVLIRDADCQHYAEKIVWLPDSYQPNDSRRPIAAETPSRAAAGLPPDGFVFCCFNNTYKITPDVFDIWMRLLRRVAGSVLWLLHDNETAAINLRHAAAQRGVDPQRLVFAPRQSLPEHLARHRLADLFLDTLPYNAHTTASDALWAGLPVLTRLGSSFAGRVAASLLTAAGLPELITTTEEAYKATAVALATDAASLAALQRKLVRLRATAFLFDSARFTRHLESAFRSMFQRHRAGLPPDHLRIPAADAPLPDRAATQHAWQATFQRGVALHQAGEHAAAAQLYEAVLRQRPAHFDALHLRGIVALQLRRTEEGLAWVRRAIAANPNVAEAHNTLGNGLRELQRYQEALACFDRALALQPDHPEARQNRAATLRRIAP